MQEDGLTRRRFLQLGAATAVATQALAMVPAAATHPTMADVPYRKREPKLGIIGTGGRGTSLLTNLVAADARVVAICDVVEAKAKAAQAIVVKAGQPSPEVYTGDPHIYQRLLQRDDIDFVVIATPWNWHAEMALYGMEHGKDVAIEVPGVKTIEDCWKIVETSERTRRHCTMLENCCYGYNETLILRMIHDGRLGEILYGEGAYLHDLRDELFSNAGEGLWRRTEHTQRNGNLYPTHGLGPVANYMGIQRGDRFNYLVSMSTPQRGFDLYRKKHLKAGDPRLSERYVCGDMNTSLIKTDKGLNITVKHTVSTPHPYDRINQVAGTGGIFEDYPPRIYIDGQNADESWGPLDPWKQYEHPLWKREGEIARKLGGHGGMDYIMLYRLLQCMRDGLPPDMDVYDAAAWASVAELSVQSVAGGSIPVQFPDFMRGAWRKRPFSAIGTQA
jgi:predicted dehydrogenase